MIVNEECHSNADCRKSAAGVCAARAHPVTVLDELKLATAPQKPGVRCASTYVESDAQDRLEWGGWHLRAAALTIGVPRCETRAHDRAVDCALPPGTGRACLAVRRAVRHKRTAAHATIVSQGSVACNMRASGSPVLRRHAVQQPDHLLACAASSCQNASSWDASKRELCCCVYRMPPRRPARAWGTWRLCS